MIRSIIKKIMTVIMMRIEMRMIKRMIRIKKNLSRTSTKRILQWQQNLKKIQKKKARISMTSY